MESSRMPSQPSDPGSVLAEADQARQRLAAGLRLPSGVPGALAGAVAVQVATAAYGIAAQTVAGLAVMLVGLAGFLCVAVVVLRQFRRVNGVRVDGLASQVVLGAGATSSSAYLGALAAATWAAFGSRWWLVSVAAVAGGVGYAVGAVRWWHAYRQDPAARAGGASPRVLAALAAMGILGLVALLLTS